MPVIKERKKSEAEATLQKAINHYRHTDELLIRASAEKHGVAYSTLRVGGCGRGTGTASTPDPILRWLTSGAEYRLLGPQE